MKKLVFLAVLAGVFLAGCQNEQPLRTDYKELEGYFVRNTVPDVMLVEKITSQKLFNTYFGTATTMNSLPTPVDFAQEFVAAVILPETSQTTTLAVDSVVRSGDNVTLYYSVNTGADQSYTTRPVLLTAIDKKYNGRLDLTANGYGAKNSFISLDLNDGKASASLRKEANQTVTFIFDSGPYTKLSGMLSSNDSTANVRFSQIIMPDGSADGPFGREITYDLPLKGSYNLIVHENMMAGDPWEGVFSIEIDLNE